jgi:hypothetical protein
MFLNLIVFIGGNTPNGRNQPKEINKQRALDHLIPPNLKNEIFGPSDDESNPFQTIVDELTEDIQTK